MDPEGLQGFCKSKPKNALDPDGKIVWNTSGMPVLALASIATERCNNWQAKSLIICVDQRR